MFSFDDFRTYEAEIVELCRRYQVKELSVIGSVARNEQREDSDIDLMVEFMPNSNVGFEYASLMMDLANVLGRKVDLASKRWLKPRIRESVLKDARVLYAA